MTTVKFQLRHILFQEKRGLTHLRQSTGSSLVQVRGCCLKVPIPEPMPTHFSTGPLGTNVREMSLTILTFHSTKYIRKCRLENGGHYVPASMYLNDLCCEWTCLFSTLKNECHTLSPYWSIRADSRLVPSQWQTSLQSHAVSHWLGSNLESALVYCCKWSQSIDRIPAGKYNQSTRDYIRFLMTFPSLLWHLPRVQ